jgi:ubiquinone/menaquinone biosynthesis C-methylase UbiE
MKENQFPYLHGFSPDEQQRLRTQAQFTEHIIYATVNFSRCERVLEIGSGVGAQSEILMRRFPHLTLECVELNEAQIQAAETHLASLNWTKDRYRIQQMNAEALNFKSQSFDAAFLCWVLEHVPHPEKILSEARRVLRPGGEIVINEVMNSSFFLEPYSPHIWKYWMAYNDYQYDHAGDPFIGAKLGNLLISQGFEDICTEAKILHFDNRFPEQRRESILFWQDLLMSGADALLHARLVDEALVDEAKSEFQKAANDPNAVFFYSFMQAKAKVL